MRVWRRCLRYQLLVALAVSITGCGRAPEASRPVFDVFEKSILELSTALADRAVSSVDLVDAYVARIETYDQRGPGLNAIVRLNPTARADAATRDEERAAGKLRGPLHGIPVLVKDNYDTAGMPTTASSIALATSVPPDDAFQVRKLRDAGAIILGKTNMHELAYGITTISSLAGQTRNPYDPERNPGGSSGGTGAAIAASFAAAGMGSDTCGSIRIPASHNSLVGLRPTLGLSSRDGIIPLSHSQDVGGPLARTVHDLALMLDATVGRDPADEVTSLAPNHIPATYVAALDDNGLTGARLGVLRALFGDQDADRPVTVIVDAAIETMKKAGAEVVEMKDPDIPKLLQGASVIRYEFASDLARYLRQTPGAPVKSLKEILDGGLYHTAVENVLRGAVTRQPDDEKQYQDTLARRSVIRQTVIDVLIKQRLDALLYPTIRRTPTRIGEANPGSNCALSASSGLPAISVPAGVAADGLPVGLELLAGPFAEPTLLRLAYAFEQHTHHRRPPASTPSLVTPPVPLTLEVHATGAELLLAIDSDVTARARFRLDPRTRELAYATSIFGVRERDVIAAHLHRRGQEATGPIIFILSGAGAARASGILRLSPRDLQDFSQGNLYFDVHTQSHAAGAARAPLAGRHPDDGESTPTGRE